MKALWTAPLIALALAFAGAAHAQATADQVSDAQVAVYKKEFEQNCRDVGLRRGEPQAQVESICACITKQVNAYASISDWRQAFFYSRQGRGPEEAQVMQRYIVRAAPVCRKL